MPATSHPLRARPLGTVLVAAGLIAALTACGGSGPPRSTAASHPAAARQSTAGNGAAGSQAPVPAESNPPGDIPDATVYVRYHSAAGHLLLKVPEGWSRKAGNHQETFTSNLNSVSIGWMPRAAAPSVSSVRASTVGSLKASTRAFRLQSVRAVSLAGGPAVEVIYQVNSPPNQVTGRQYRLVIERFELFRKGRGAVLSLSSAVGSDNVDPWRIVSESFRWT